MLNNIELFQTLRRESGNVCRRSKKSESAFSKNYDKIWQKGPAVKYQNQNGIAENLYEQNNETQ